MRRWDLFLVVAILLGTLAAGAVDWRAGAAVLGICLASVWYWLDDVRDG